MQPEEPEAIRFTKTALELNPPDSTKARLLFVLGDAFYMIKDQQSIEQSITYYANGFNLESILDSDRVKFCLKIGNAYLARNQRGDEDLAIQYFEKGFKFNSDDSLISELHFGIGTAYKQKAESMQQKFL
jgi:tetratricopeptide (TPR) repeat protein